MSPVRLRIRELRKLKGLSQAALAERAGLSRATVSLLENGKAVQIHFATLEKLAIALGTDPAMLVTSEKARKAR